MKKILVISTLFLLTTIAQLFAVEFKVLDSDSYVVDRLNSFRSNPIDYLYSNFPEEILGAIDLDNKTVFHHNDFLVFDEILDNVSRIRLADMFEREYISESTPEGLTSTSIASQLGFSGFLKEQTIFMAFENFISPERALNIFVNYAVYAYLMGYDGYSLVGTSYFNKIGSTFIAGNFMVGDKQYNVYGLNVILGW